MGRDSPLCGGRGGSAYFSSPQHGLLGENSIVGAGVPIADRRRSRVVVCCRQDGEPRRDRRRRDESGAVHEALNFAGVYRLPLVVVVENNVYSELTPIAAMIPTETLVERAAIYGMLGLRVDGNDADEVYDALAEAILRARDGDGPLAD